MIKSRKSLKDKVANLANKTNIPNKYLIQRFMFESFLKRLSISKYKDKFVIKGGFLLASIFGVDLRSTMDLDTTIKGFKLDEDTITKVIKEIIGIEINDGISLEFENIKKIRIDSDYQGYNVNINAEFDGLRTNLLIDITTGDVITYKEIEYSYKTLFDSEIINLFSYNLETIISEKYEAIISRNIDNTRMKDFYDIYMLVHYKWLDINKELLIKAIKNTSLKRNTFENIKQSSEYINLIKNDSQLKELWNNYAKNYPYAENIKYQDIIESIQTINDIIDYKEN